MTVMMQTIAYLTTIYSTGHSVRLLSGESEVFPWTIA